MGSSSQCIVVNHILQTIFCIYTLLFVNSAVNLLCDIASTRLYQGYTKSMSTWTWYGAGMEKVWSG